MRQYADFDGGKSDSDFVRGNSTVLRIPLLSFAPPHISTPHQRARLCPCLDVPSPSASGVCPLGGSKIPQESTFQSHCIRIPDGNSKAHNGLINSASV